MVYYLGVISYQTCYQTSTWVCFPIVAGSSEGSILMSENEEMYVLEQDQGDGWTRVRREDGSEGFVPTSYVTVHLYESDQVW